ncbi:MAG: MerR family transcriptional regulator [Acidobacteriota bacterium]|nr:MerR family transcriptional regulator [Acidobacteriota bacterium]
MAAKDGGLQIPNKLYFRIGEVSEITGVQPYTLRHWEMEFPTLSPKKNDSGQRLYRKEDIEMVHTIQRLLHSEGYTTAGARRLLSAKSGKRGRPVIPKPPPEPQPEPASVSPEVLKEVREALDLMDVNDKRLAALEG